MIKTIKPKDGIAVSKLLFDSFQEYRSLYTPAAFEVTVIKPATVLQRMKEGPIWVATDKAKLIGTVSLLIKKNDAYIRSMAVHPQARGQKVGFRLLQTIEEFAKSNHCSRLILSTTPFLKKAIRLYDKFGFVKTDEGPHDLFGTPLFTMSKSLIK